MIIFVLIGWFVASAILTVLLLNLFNPHTHKKDPWWVWVIGGPALGAAYTFGYITNRNKDRKNNANRTT